MFAHYDALNTLNLSFEMILSLAWIWQAAIQAAGDAGQLFITAAGNDHKDIDKYPCHPASYDLDNMIVVSATDQAEHLTKHSNTGPNSVHLAAPGLRILSTIPIGSYGWAAAI